MLQRLLPHPILSVALVLVWLMLVNHVSLGNLLLGALLVAVGLGFARMRRQVAAAL